CNHFIHFEFAIDSRSGETHLILDDDSLDILIQNQKYGNEF
ncbi:hypothetical protein LB324_15620, partial [Staphylococcus aureus]